MQNNNQAREFITALTGSDSSEITFQAFFDPKGVDAPSGVEAETWTSTLDESLEFLDYKQSQQCGIYMCVNGTDGQGRKVDNITDLRVVFVDFDGMDEPEWSLQPHLIQSRDETHGHAFWLIDAGDLTHEEWTIIQKQLSIYYSSDSQVIDPCRVIRVPGSLHFKDPSSPKMYSITYNGTGDGHKYSIDDVRENHILSPDLDAELNEWVINREANMSGAGYDNDPAEIKKFQAFVTHAAHPAVEGSGSHELFRVSCFAHDHGIDLNHSLNILWEHYNPRCIPPWTDDERDQFEGVCIRAYKYPSSAAGCKSAKAAFLELPPLEEPKCGWDEMKSQFNHTIQIKTEFEDTLPTLGNSVERNHRISIQNAAAMSAQITIKSSHYDFGLVYDGLKHDGLNLIKSSKQFYRFTGKSWKEVEDDVVKADIQRTFAAYKPANKFTSGVHAVVCDLVNHEQIDNGLWLTDEKYDTSNLAVFQNGIVDLSSKKLELLPHTYEFFTLSELSYDFDPDAQCLEWDIFLQNIWGDDQKLKDQLQEWMGYCLVNDVSLHKFAIFMGKSRAGKGVIIDVISKMIGEDNTCSPSLSNLSKDSALEEMSKKSLTLIPDAHSVHPTTRDVVLSNLKAITGGDKLSFHEMYKGSRNKMFTTKVMLSTNNVPDFNDSSGALVARMLVWPFHESFLGREDYELRNKVFAELPGITQWSITGLRRLRANNNIFTESDSGKREKEEIRKDMFPLAQYVERSLVMEEGEFTLLEDMYNAYRLWAASEGVKSPMIKTHFNKHLRNSALPIKYENITVPGYHGVTIKSMMPNSNVVAMRPNPNQ